MWSQSDYVTGQIVNWKKERKTIKGIKKKQQKKGCEMT